MGMVAAPNAKSKITGVAKIMDKISLVVSLKRKKCT